MSSLEVNESKKKKRIIFENIKWRTVSAMLKFCMMDFGWYQNMGSDHGTKAELKKPSFRTYRNFPLVMVTLFIYIVKPHAKNIFELKGLKIKYFSAKSHVW